MPSPKRRSQQRVNWRTIYGSRLTPAYRDTGMFDADNKPVMEKTAHLVRQFSHSVGAILATAPKRTKGEPRFYLVFPDHSLRRSTQRAADLLGSLPLGQRVAQFVKPEVAA